MPLANTANALEEVLDDTRRDSRILIVEDDPNYRFFLYQTLSKEGYRNIEQAANGNEGFHKTLEYLPDIVILDLMMPICNGFEYCERIRALPQFADMPILVQTGLGDLEMHQRSFRAGATDLLTKPVNAEEFLARTRAHLERYKLACSMDDYREILRTELDTANSMQRFFMPNPKQIAQYENEYPLRISHHYQSSGLIGGDVWNMVPISPSEIMVYACDFSGQGIFSAMQAMRYHTLVARLAEETPDPGAALTKLNLKLRELLDEDQHTLMFMGILNLAKNQITYACAGAPAPFIIHPQSGRMEQLTISDQPLGVDEAHIYTSHTAAFASGDSLFLYSDALYSTCRADGTCMDASQAAEMARSCLMQVSGVDAKHKAFHACMCHNIEASNAVLADDLLMLLVSRV